jgi:hypothetical protein
VKVLPVVAVLRCEDVNAGLSNRETSPLTNG